MAPSSTYRCTITAVDASCPFLRATQKESASNHYKRCHQLSTSVFSIVNKAGKSFPHQLHRGHGELWECPLSCGQTWEQMERQSHACIHADRTPDTPPPARAEPRGLKRTRDTRPANQPPQQQQEVQQEAQSQMEIDQQHTDERDAVPEIGKTVPFGTPPFPYNHEPRQLETSPPLEQYGLAVNTVAQCLVCTLCARAIAPSTAAAHVKSVTIPGHPKQPPPAKLTQITAQIQAALEDYQLCDTAYNIDNTRQREQRYLPVQALTVYPGGYQCKTCYYASPNHDTIIRHTTCATPPSYDKDVFVQSSGQATNSTYFAVHLPLLANTKPALLDEAAIAKICKDQLDAINDASVTAQESLVQGHLQHPVYRQLDLYNYFHRSRGRVRMWVEQPLRDAHKSRNPLERQLSLLPSLAQSLFDFLVDSVHHGDISVKRLLINSIRRGEAGATYEKGQYFNKMQERKSEIKYAKTLANLISFFILASLGDAVSTLPDSPDDKNIQPNSAKTEPPQDAESFIPEAIPWAMSFSTAAVRAAENLLHELDKLLQYDPRPSQEAAEPMQEEDDDEEDNNGPLIVDGLPSDNDLDFHDQFANQALLHDDDSLTDVSPSAKYFGKYLRKIFWRPHIFRSILTLDYHQVLQQMGLQETQGPSALPSAGSRPRTRHFKSPVDAFYDISPVHGAVLALLKEVFIGTTGGDSSVSIIADPVVSFLFLQTVYIDKQAREKHVSFASTFQISPKIAQLKYNIRLIIFAAGAQSTAALGRDNKLLDVLQDHYHRYIIADQQTPFGALCSIDGLVAANVLRVHPVPKLTWLCRPNKFTFRDAIWDLCDVAQWLVKELFPSVQVMLSEDLLLKLDLKRGLQHHLPSLSMVADNTDDKAPHGSYMTHPSNSFLNHFQSTLTQHILSNSELSEQWLSKTDFTASGLPKYKYRVAESYLQTCYDFHVLFIILIHWTSGPPSRMTEVASATIRNPDGATPRSLFVNAGQFGIATAYHKMSSRVGHGKTNARFLHPDFSDVLFVYLTIVRPFATVLARQLYGEAVGVAWGTLLWPAPVTGSPDAMKLGAAINKIHAARFPVQKMTIASIRHCAIATWRNKIVERQLELDLDEMYELDDPTEVALEHAAKLQNMNRDGVIDLMAQHSTAIADQIYGNAFGDAGSAVR